MDTRDKFGTMHSKNQQATFGQVLSMGATLREQMFDRRNPKQLDYNRSSVCETLDSSFNGRVGVAHRHKVKNNEVKTLVKSNGVVFTTYIPPSIFSEESPNLRKTHDPVIIQTDCS